jgi:hypothetical protein
MIDPRGMAWQDWASSVVLVVGDAWSFGAPPSEDGWRDFAVGFVRAPTFAQRVPPDPYQFDNWREWAMRMYPILEGTS